jgi:hypothetical protein
MFAPAFTANAVGKAPVIDGAASSGEWDAGVTCPLGFNHQLSTTDLTAPPWLDLYGSNFILWVLLKNHEGHEEHEGRKEEEKREREGKKASNMRILSVFSLSSSSFSLFFRGLRVLRGDLPTFEYAPDLYADWRIIYNGNILYGMVKRNGDRTVVNAKNLAQKGFLPGLKEARCSYRI